MFQILELLNPLTDRWEAQRSPQQHPGVEAGPQDRLPAAAEDLREAWGRSLRCQLQLQTRLELLLDWAVCLRQDGGILGKEIPMSE